MRFVFLLIAITITTSDGGKIGRLQSVAVSGQLKCDGKPAVGLRVDLMESDNNLEESGIIDDDDFMNYVISDDSGSFSVNGSEIEISGIEPYVNIFHKCDDGMSPCQRVLRINVPKSATVWGDTPTEVFSIGTFELSGKVLGERRSCAYRNLTATSSA
ncbi:CBN-TTR-1 protein [Caenorhabditis brenneri]|uniref:CBN-TTR-1 protein n=1 Tax=Caenorhabditis brenneri TaxID=135651 RepID=G0MKE6_CAEBE|nr:CBN-TTR-1 protein [Caenorhabditis brenneri]